MNTKFAIILALFGTVIALAVAEESPVEVTEEVEIDKVIGYAEQFVDCLVSCKEKYGKHGSKKQYPQKEKECKLTCEEKFSNAYGSFGFYPQKEFECNQQCNVSYDKKPYPEKNAECHQRCGEKYGFRKPHKKTA